MARGRCAVLLCSILLLAAAWASADVPYVVGSGWTYFGTADYQPGPYGGIGGTFDPPNNEPFTFTLLVPGFLKVTDAFLAGDYIRVYDNGMDISSTPVVPVDPSIWESDPDVGMARSKMEPQEVRLGSRQSQPAVPEPPV